MQDAKIKTARKPAPEPAKPAPPKVWTGTPEDRLLAAIYSKAGE